MATIDGTKKKLTVSGEAIESAVNSKHEHSNKTVLEKLTDNNGTLQYNGSDITGGGSSYTLPTASETVLGGVMVDGTTITVNGDGIIQGVEAKNVTSISVDEPVRDYTGLEYFENIDYIYCSYWIYDENDNYDVAAEKNS